MGMGGGVWAGDAWELGAGVVVVGGTGKSSMQKLSRKGLGPLGPDWSQGAVEETFRGVAVLSMESLLAFSTVEPGCSL